MEPIWRTQIEDIFFATSSRKDFSSQQERADFFQRWTQPYFELFPELIFLAKEGPKLMGYLMGCSDSQIVRTHFEQHLPSQLTFADQWVKFPAHLHMNTHPQFQGRGVGAMLLNQFLETLQQRKIPGVHIITSPEQRNVDFYHKHGFTHTLERTWRTHSLLFMGRSIP